MEYIYYCSLYTSSYSNQWSSRNEFPRGLSVVVPCGAVCAWYNTFDSIFLKNNRYSTRAADNFTIISKLYMDRVIKFDQR